MEISDVRKKSRRFVIQRLSVISPYKQWQQDQSQVTARRGALAARFVFGSRISLSFHSL